MANDDEYQAILRATYDYTPQSDDEISIKEDQLLLLIQRVDDDWWKVKVKGDSQDDDSPVGLVPAAWVEPAEHSSVVKALYEYAATAPGELTIAEDEVLLVFGREEDWLLVQSSKKDGKAGFVPANYVEPHDDEEEETQPSQPQIVVPPSPPPPASTYTDPQDLVASSKANADDIKTWSVSEIDKKGKKTKGTLGIGNGAIFFASESSKAAVRKWQSKDLGDVSTDKGKHIHFNVGGASPEDLHFSVASRENAEAILVKLNASKALTEPSETPRKPSVHFSSASPTMIPPQPEDSSEEEGEADAPVEQAEQVVVAYAFNADQDDEMTVKAGEILTVIEKDEDWWKCRNSKGQEGVVPASYVELTNSANPSEPQSDDEDDEAAAAQAAEEAEAAAERERQERKQEKEREQTRQREEKARRELEMEEAKKKRQKEAEEKEKERTRKEAAERAKVAADAAEVERKKRKEAANARVTPAPAPRPSSEARKAEKPSSSSSGFTSGENNKPPSERVRVWQDRTGQFRTDAAFLGFANGKLRLHKTNGVIVEVPAEKMSAEDMKYVEKMMSRQSRSKSTTSTPRRISDDDVPLAVQHPNSANGRSSRSNPPKKGPSFDWFDFFLGAGCDMDDCNRYAASFERDKIDEAILLDITESTMRTLGLREGDIIRVTKAISLRKPKSPVGEDGPKPSPHLFTEPGGGLKSNVRRTRPTPSKTLPPNTVDFNVIGDQPTSPQSARPSSTPAVAPPPRSSSAAPTASGFDDDAWTVRSKPMTPTPAPENVRAPSAPPTTTAPAPAPAVSIKTEPPKPATPQPPVTDSSTSKTLASTTEADIFDQLSRLSELRKTTPVVSTPPVASPVQTTVAASPPPPSFHVGLGMGSSPVPMGQFIQPHATSIPPVQPAYNGPRAPFAPVPANQGLLQPLIPTQTGFNSFVPTRPTNSVSPFQPSQQVSSPFLTAQPTGFMGNPTLMAQPTGFSAPVVSQPTGLPFSNNGFSQMNGSVGSFHSPFNPGMNGIPSVPTLPTSAPAVNNTSPANVFAQMKSGTFANDDNSGSQADRYDALRTNTTPILTTQPTGWGAYQPGFR